MSTTDSPAPPRQRGEGRHITRGQDATEFHPPSGWVSDDGDWYEFSCGCRFPIDHDLPAVHGHPSVIYDVQAAPLTCEATWDLISSGRTKGVFQLESSLGKCWAKRLKPRSIEHLAALTALLRPGCLASRDERGVSMTELYCRRKNGEEPVTVDIEAVRSILEPTYDIVVFQEQFMQIAQVVAAFNLVEVDKLRKAAGKKDQQAMTEVGVLFVDKATALGLISREDAERLFANIKKSARYAFNLAHSVSYALDAYYTAHEKTHWPLYFFTAYLRYAIDKQKPLDEIRALINDARSFGYSVQPPRFSELEAHFATNGVDITFGLSDVKDIGERSVAQMVAAVRDREQESGQPVTTWSWYDFLVYFSEQSDARTIKRMIEVGALRDLGIDRLRLLAEYDAWKKLTDTERRHIAALGEPYIQMKAVRERVEVDVLDLPKGLKKKDVLLQMSEDEARARYGTKKVLQSKPVHDEAGDVVYEAVTDDLGNPVVLAPASPCTSLVDALRSLLDRPGAVTKGRREHVESTLALLLRPPTPLVDKPYWIAKKEEETLGVPLTFTHVEGADQAKIDATCKEVREGRIDRDATIGVEIQEVRENTVKNGPNRGKTMAYLAVADKTGPLDDVTVFADSWKRFGRILSREKAVVAITGYISQDRGSFIVKNVEEI